MFVELREYLVPTNVVEMFFLLSLWRCVGVVVNVGVVVVVVVVSVECVDVVVSVECVDVVVSVECVGVVVSVDCVGLLFGCKICKYGCD